MNRMLTLILLLAIGASTLAAQFAEDMQGLPEVDRANFQAMEANAALSDLNEMEAAFDSIEEVPAKESDESKAKRLEARSIQIKRVVRAYRQLLSRKSTLEEVLPEVKDERWINVWSHVGTLLETNIERESDIETAWLEAFNEDAQVAFESAKSSANAAALLEVPAKFPLSPFARKASLFFADTSFERGALGDATTGYLAYFGLSRYQVLPDDEAALASLKGFLAARSVGWLRRAEQFEEVAKIFATTKIQEGEKLRELHELVAEIKLLNPERDSLKDQCEDGTNAFPTATLAGQASSRRPGNVEERPWELTKIPGPTSRLEYGRLRSLLPVEVSPILPTVTPSSILINSGESLRAFDLFTGKSIWGKGIGLDAPKDAFHYAEQDPNLVLMSLRWGELAIAPLENPLSFATQAPSRKYVGRFPVVSQVPVVRRSLVAIDHASGKIRWKIGGAYSLSAADEKKLPALEAEVATISFLTATVYNDILYALGTLRENETQLYLVAIDPAKGKPLWKLTLGAGQGESNMFGNPLREAMPGIPVVAEGVLFASTNLGALVAVDLSARSVKWVSRYEAMPRPFTRTQSAVFRKTTFANGAPTVARLKNDKAVVVVAPTDSLYLTVFHAESGKVQWQLRTEFPQEYPNARRDNDRLQPNVLIGTYDGHAYFGAYDTLYRISLEDVGKREFIKVRIRTSSVTSENILNGRPTIAGGFLYWPGANGLAVIDISRPKLSTTPSRVTEGAFGNLHVARGALVSVHGRSYVASRAFSAYLDVRFDSAMLLVNAKREAEANPDDARLQLRLVQLATQLGAKSGMSDAEVESILRKVIELSQDSSELADVSSSATRALFSRLIKAVATAKRTRDFDAFKRLLVEAKGLITTDQQALSLFLYEEEYVLDELNDAAQIAFYQHWADANARFEMTLRGAPIPLRIYAHWSLAAIQRSAKRYPEALASLDQVLAWAIKAKAGQFLATKARGSIAEVVDLDANAYASLDIAASQAFAQAQELPASESSIAILEVIERYSHAKQVYPMIREVLAKSTKEAYPEIATRAMKAIRKMPKDQARANILVSILERHLADSRRVSALQVAGALSSFDQNIKVTFAGKEFTIGKLLKAQDMVISSVGAKESGFTMKPQVAKDSSWTLSFKPERVQVDARYKPSLRIIRDVRVSGDVSFLAASRGSEELIAMQTSTGKVLWRSPNMSAANGVSESGERYVVFESKAIIALNKTNGSRAWRVDLPGSVLTSEVVEGMALVCYREESIQNRRLGMVALNLETGKEIWARRTAEWGRVTHARRGRWVYYIQSPAGQETKVVKLDLVSGEEVQTGELDYTVSANSTIHFASNNDMVLRAVDEKSRKHVVLVIDSETLEKKKLVGRVTLGTTLAFVGDRLILTKRDGFVSVHSLIDAEEVWSARNRPGFAAVSRSVVIGDRLALIWQPNNQTREVWLTLYELKSGKRLFHDALWTPKSLADVMSVEAHANIIKGGILLCVQTMERKEVVLPGGMRRVSSAFKPVQSVLFDSVTLAKQDIPLFKEAGKVLYRQALYAIAAPTPQGLLLTDGSEKAALYPLVKADKE